MIRHDVWIVSVMIATLSVPIKAFPYDTIEVFHGGTIRGQIVWAEAAIPEPVIHQVEKNPDFCGETAVDDALVVHPENRGMHNVVVYLEDILTGREPKSRYVNIIEKCRFHPRVMPTVQGKKIGFRHNDFILHNIHAFRMDNNATVFNIGLPIHRWQQVVDRKILREGLFRLQCDIHAHMNGLIVSLDHDYFAVTDSNGHYEISDIPPGSYRLVALQAGYRIENWSKTEEGRRPVFEPPHQLSRQVEVKEDGETIVQFDFRSID